MLIASIEYLSSDGYVRVVSLVKLAQFFPSEGTVSESHYSRLFAGHIFRGQKVCNPKN